MSDARESTGKPSVKRARPSRARDLAPAVRAEPLGYVAMHEVNAAICLAGGILAPRFEESAARDHHVSAGGIQIDPAAPSASSLAEAQGDLQYGNVVVFEVPLRHGGLKSVPLWRATRLIFESREACELFRARMSGYGDVPGDILPMDVDAKIFAVRSSSAQASLILAASEVESATGVTKAAVASEANVAAPFRAVDRCAGGLLGAASTLDDSLASSRIVEAMGGLALADPSASPVEQFASTIALLADSSPEGLTFVHVLSAIASVLTSGLMDNGFSATALLREAETISCSNLHEGSPQEQAIRTFWDFTKEVLAMRREVPVGAWSDEGGSAVARGTLAFLLNPEPEQLQALRYRTPDLGSAVHFVAGLLVGIRSGLTRMGTDVKASRGPFLVGAAFVHDWLHGQHPSLALQRSWDSKDGSCECAMVYEGVGIARVKEPADRSRAALAGALRAVGIDARFSPQTGVLSGSLGADLLEATFGMEDGILPAFPRQPTIEVWAIVPGKLARRAADSLVVQVNGETRNHGVFAQLVGEPAGGATVRLSVFVLGVAAVEPLKEAMLILVAKARGLVPPTPAKPPRRATGGNRASRTGPGTKSQPAS